MEVISWLDATLARNRSPRAEQIMAEIHGLPEDKPEDVPDSKLSFAEVAASITYGRLIRTFKRRWEAR